MKHLISIFSILVLFTSCCHTEREVKDHYLSFADSEALHDFFRYREGAPPIVQGHRGARENGLPENSIAAMEYVLEQMPAIFEIDPRLTKDSVIVVFHDATLDRTTDGTGRVADYTWAELQQLSLKNAAGEVTPHKIPTLTEVLEWARGRTALLLDKKDVPLQMIADMIRLHDANNYVINLVRSPGDAAFYFNDEPRRMFAVSIRTPGAFPAYMEAGIPASQMFVCIGVEINEHTEQFCTLMRGHGIRCLMAASSTYDKLPTAEERAEAFRKIIESGVTILESNYPVETGKALGIIKDK